MGILPGIISPPAPPGCIDWSYPYAAIGLLLAFSMYCRLALSTISAFCWFILSCSAFPSSDFSTYILKETQKHIIYIACWGTSLINDCC